MHCKLHCITKHALSSISPKLEALSASPWQKELEVVNPSPKLDAVVINTNFIAIVYQQFLQNTNNLITSRGDVLISNKTLNFKG